MTKTKYTYYVRPAQIVSPMFSLFFLASPKMFSLCSHFFFTKPKCSHFFLDLKKCSQKNFRGFAATNTFNRGGGGGLQQNYFYKIKVCCISWTPNQHFAWYWTKLVLIMSHTTSAWVILIFDDSISCFTPSFRGSATWFATSAESLQHCLGTSTQLTNFPAPHVHWWTDP